MADRILHLAILFFALGMVGLGKLIGWALRERMHVSINDSHAAMERDGQALQELYSEGQYDPNDELDTLDEPTFDDEWGDYGDTMEERRGER